LQDNPIVPVLSDSSLERRMTANECGTKSAMRIITILQPTMKGSRFWLRSLLSVKAIRVKWRAGYYMSHHRLYISGNWEKTTLKGEIRLLTP
jgi:hypothetical protein